MQSSSAPLPPSSQLAPPLPQPADPSQIQLFSPSAPALSVPQTQDASAPPDEALPPAEAPEFAEEEPQEPEPEPDELESPQESQPSEAPSVQAEAQEDGAKEKSDANDVSRALDSIGQALRTAGHTASDIQEILAGIRKAPGAQARLGKFGARLKMASDVAEMGEAIARNDGDKVLLLSAQLALDFARNKGLVGAIGANVGEVLVDFVSGKDKSPGHLVDLLAEKAGDVLSQLGLGINIPGIGPLTVGNLVDVKGAVVGFKDLAKALAENDPEAIRAAIAKIPVLQDVQEAQQRGENPLAFLGSKFAQAIMDLPNAIKNFGHEEGTFYYTDKPDIDVEALNSNIQLLAMREEVMGETPGYDTYTMLRRSVEQELQNQLKARQEAVKGTVLEGTITKIPENYYKDVMGNLKVFSDDLEQGKVNTDVFVKTPILAELLSGRRGGFTRERLADFRQQMRNFSVERARQAETALDEAGKQAFEKIADQQKQETTQELLQLARRRPERPRPVRPDLEPIGRLDEDAALGPEMADAVELGPQRARAKRYLPMTFAERKKRGRFTALVQEKDPYRAPIQRFLM